MIEILILVAILLVIFWRATVSPSGIRVLVRQAARYSLASEQDTNPLIRVLHANYGVGYLSALKDIASDSQILIASGVDISRLTQRIVANQDAATKQLMEICPGYAPQSQFLERVAAD